MYGLEYFLVIYLRDILDGVIDLFLMGCRIGFYLILWGDVDVKIVKIGLEEVLKKVFELDKMLVVIVIECGNYRDLFLFGVKEYVKDVLDKGFFLNIYGE